MNDLDSVKLGQRQLQLYSLRSQGRRLQRPDAIVIAAFLMKREVKQQIPVTERHRSERTHFSDRFS